MKTPTIFALALLFATSSFAAGITKESIASGGKQRTYYLFVPDRPADAPAAPIVVLLHGSGRNGRILIEHWQKLAQKEGIVLAGPDSTDSKMWSYPIDGPDFLRDVIDSVKVRTVIDPRRMYLFGHSAGACFALQMAITEPNYFAAIAVHAGALPPGDLAMIETMTRKIPITIQVGTEDPYFSLADVRRTKDAFEKSAIPVDLREIRFHNHDYYRISGNVNEYAWTFLRTKALQADPTFVEYATK